MNGLRIKLSYIGGELSYMSMVSKLFNVDCHFSLIEILIADIVMKI